MTYKGTVSIMDDNGKGASAAFTIYSIVDSDGDGLNNELEVQLGLANASDPIDNDEDGLLDFYELYYSFTNLTNWDTDNDSLPDGYMPEFGVGEFYLGTDPLDWDTDDDGLFDGEWFGWNISVKCIGSNSFLTEHVSSNPLLTDTDADGLDDFIEFQNDTNPSAADTDGDGLSDIKEFTIGTEPNNWDSDGDSLSDGEEVNVYHTDPLAQDTDSDGLSDAEEIKGIIVLTNTNLLVNDTDADGLLDSQEVFDMTEVLTDSSGKEVRPKVAAGTAQTFYLRDVPNIRTAQSASTTVQISSGEGRAKSMQYALEYSALRNGRVFTSGIIKNEPYHTQVIDVKPLMARKGASSYGGAWTLTVWADYDCVVEEFSLSLSGLLDGNDPDSDDDLISDGVEANPLLNNGWLTDPFKADTDGDGWDDYQEIYRLQAFRGYSTSPLSWDTDSDGISDPRDLHPLKNIMVAVSLLDVA